MALMRVPSSGVRKGVYRFATHEAANRASKAAISVAILLNLKHLAHTPTSREKDKMDRVILERALAAIR